jgi:hypothetical protein
MTPRRRPETRPASAADSRAYLAKAREYLRASADSLEIGNFTAATGTAVHAGISAGDAVAAIRAEAIWRGEHSQAARYLDKYVGDDGRRAAKHLQRLLPLKSTAEYDPDPIPPAKAAAAVESARRIVAIAEQVVNDAAHRLHPQKQ